MDDLNKPLGQKPAKQARSRAPLWAAALALGVAGLGYLFWTSQSANQPDTVVAIKDAKVEPEPVPPPQPAQPVAPAPVEPAPQTAQQPDPPSQTAFRPRTDDTPKRPAWVFMPELAEETDNGILPKISTGGIRPLDAYSNPLTTIGPTRIAIVIGGLGISQTGTQKAIDDLDSEVTLGFSAVGNSLNRWMQVARKQGHEVALQIPMEPIGYPTVDPGRNTLLADAPPAENIARLHSALGRMTNYPVVMNYLGGNFANKREAIEPILKELRDRGLAYLDDGSSAASIALDLAEELRLPNGVGSIILDDVRDPKAIENQLRNIELLAQRRGFAIATGTAFPETIAQVQAYIADAKKRGIQIVPLSNLMRDYPR
ncbi:divergent polysaccharide deacetylase family protein [Pseudahrensia aquimaris]|uniref:Divergent polysaccharide deacetylase family protein n=1 Tax=Pseudahrensia aquimaris TaxID=744461 RepID=A0ABW3FDL0_9HYPH